MIPFYVDSQAFEGGYFFSPDKPFQLTDFLNRIRDSKLRANVEEVIVPSERLDMQDMIGRGEKICLY